MRDRFFVTLYRVVVLGEEKANGVNFGILRLFGRVAGKKGFGALCKAAGVLLMISNKNVVGGVKARSRSGR